VETLHGACDFCIAQFWKHLLNVWIEIKEIVITVTTAVVIFAVVVVMVALVIVVAVVVHIFKHLHGYVFDYSKTGEYVSIHSFG
jgi:hypothetical protein